MTMPTDLVIVRHGNSEGNLVFNLGKKGDNTLPEDTWRYFDPFPEVSDPREYKMVFVDKLIPTKGPPGGLLRKGQLSSVEKAYSYMAAMVHGDGGGTKRAPLDVRENVDGTYLVIDGNATLAVARNQGWKELPVRVISK